MRMQIVSFILLVPSHLSRDKVEKEDTSFKSKRELPWERDK